MSKRIEEIWGGKNPDLFNRKEEAINLQAYLESIYKLKSEREDSKGFVLAVDADYGMGKTFFLKRFADQMAINHPVAYIDAWKDDLQDEPLIALLATLQEALKPYFSDKPIIKENLKDVINKAQKVIGKGAQGLFLRALGAIFTPKIVEAMSETLSLEASGEKEELEERIKEVEKDIISGAPKVSEIFSKESDFNKRIKKFADGQEALKQLKESLNNLVKSLKSEEGDFAPIVIIIDELDRCRPTYAIKLLEEIKHLFDVEGIVFILGMNKSQLANSVCQAYGNKFAGERYLERFIDRNYTLKLSDFKNYIEAKFNSLNINTNCFVYPSISRPNNTRTDNFVEVLATIFELYGFSLRDSSKAMSNIETVSLVSQDNQILLPWLIRELAKIQLGIKYPEIVSIEEKNISLACFTTDEDNRNRKQQTYYEYIKTIESFLAQNYEQNRDTAKLCIFRKQLMFNFYKSNKIDNSIHNLRNYSDLINFVSRIE